MVFDEYIERAGEVEGGRSAELTEILMKHLDLIPENHRTALLRVQRTQLPRNCGGHAVYRSEREDMDSPCPA